MTECETKYLETVLWAETVCLPCPEDELCDGEMDVDDEHPLYDITDCEPLDKYFDTGDFDVASVKKALIELSAFFVAIKKAGLYDEASEYDDDQGIAHNFWLTRNGHGAGFWDGDYGDELGGKLTDIAKQFGEQSVLVNSDGSVSLY